MVSGAVAVDSGPAASFVPLAAAANDVRWGPTDGRCGHCGNNLGRKKMDSTAAT
jgi:hypothetical protein